MDRNILADGGGIGSLTKTSDFPVRENYIPFYEERGRLEIDGYKNHSFSLHFRRYDEAKEEDIITPP